jgi:hypothetical protein
MTFLGEIFAVDSNRRIITHSAKQHYGAIDSHSGDHAALMITVRAKGTYSERHRYKEVPSIGARAKDGRKASLQSGHSLAGIPCCI